MILTNLFVFIVPLLSVAGTSLYETGYNKYIYNPEIKGWIKIRRVPGTWYEAWQRCHLEGSILASPINTKFARVIRNIMYEENVDVPIVTGIHATFSARDYTSIEGVPLADIPVRWAPGEPDNVDDKERVLLFYPNGTMADAKTSDSHPYMCYKKATKDTVLTECGTFDKAYHLDNRTGSCYKFHRTPHTWSKAFSICSAEGGYLVVINSEVEAQVLREIFTHHPPEEYTIPFKNSAIIGFLDWNKQGTWLTIHGDTLEEAGYPKWSGGQPDNAQAPNGHTWKQQCGGIFRSGLLDDIWCEQPFPFICEKSTQKLYYNLYEGLDDGQYDFDIRNNAQ